MKRFIICTLLVAAFGVSSHIQAQEEFLSPDVAWGLSAGGVQGTNSNGDQWMMQYRAFFQGEISPMLLGQGGIGYVGLKSPGVYSAYSATADLRLLFSPFSIPNLDPYVYAGFGVSKTLKSGSDVLAMIPVGLGVHTRIAPGVLLQIAGGYNLYLSDDLDSRARSSNNTNVLTNSKNDGFYGFSIGLAFSLGTMYTAEGDL